MQLVEFRDEQKSYRVREAFKTLRTNLEFSGENIKVICLTSCTPGEGKSTTSFDLATSFANGGKKTLLIDADLRKSVMKSKFKRSKARLGLTNYLAGRAELQDVICATNFENFHLIFAGPVPPNPSELLGSQRFEKLIEKAREYYDIVIIDTPPLGSVIDTAVVSKKCDGAVMVIASGDISYRFARKVKEQLSVTGCKILGCILNKVNMSGKGFYGKYYGKYYGNYGSEEGATAYK